MPPFAKAEAILALLPGIRKPSSGCGRGRLTRDGPNQSALQRREPRDLVRMCRRRDAQHLYRSRPQVRTHRRQSGLPGAETKGRWWVGIMLPDYDTTGQHSSAPADRLPEYDPMDLDPPLAALSAASLATSSARARTAASSALPASPLSAPGPHSRIVNADWCQGPGLPDDHRLRGRRAKWVPQEVIADRIQRRVCFRCARKGCRSSECPLAATQRPLEPAHVASPAQTPP